MTVNRAILSLLVLGFCSVSLPAAAQSQTCNPTMPTVVIETPPGNVQYTDAYDVAFASGDKYAMEKSLPNGARLLGIAQVRLKIWTAFQGRGNFQCYQPERVAILIGFDDPMQIAIDARYFQNSCNYQAIKQHEDEHIAISRMAVLNHVGDVRQSVESAIARALPYLGSTPNAYQAFKELVEAAVNQAAQTIVAERDARNAQLDSPESYKRTQDQCQNW